MKYVYVIAFYVVFFAFYSSPSLATIIHVPDDYPTIQEAIEASVDFDTVLVQPGLYVDTLNFNGKNIVLGSLYITTGDTSFISLTVLDGDTSGTVVKFDSGEDQSAVLSGFTIQNGSRGGIGCENNSNPNINNVILMKNSNNRDPMGGGMWVERSDPSLENVIFKDNHAGASGGLYTHESDITIRNCLFRENSTANAGGAAWFYESNPIITNCKFINNWAYGWGGAIYFRRCYVVMDSCLFEGNQSLYEDGGGISSDWSHGLKMKNTIFRNNSAHTIGGGFFRAGIDSWNHKGNDYLESVMFSGNAAREGGGFFTVLLGDLRLNNVVFSKNFAEVGGGIYVISWDNLPDLTLQNAVFEDNLADTGSVIHCNGGDHVLINSILWNNIIPEITFADVEESHSFLIAFSDIENEMDAVFPVDSTEIFWMEGNMDKDPLFVYPAEGIYNLQENSPCIDVGTAFYVFDGDTIINYHPGQYNGLAPDMGAFEFGPPLNMEHEFSGIDGYELYQNYPNPFNPTTVIGYRLSAISNVELSIYNLLGQKVVVLVSEKQEAGNHQIEWDASGFATGMYYYEIKIDNFHDIKKMILLR
jgi:hypothetical protein